eukprot:446500-Prymnesium_polylepis.2
MTSGVDKGTLWEAKGFVFASQPFERLDGKRSKYPSLLEILADEQHPAAQRQLATHLDRFPPEGFYPIVGPKHDCSMAQWSRQT